MEREIRVRDYIEVLIKWRKLILLNVFIITVLAIIISLVLPKKYTSTASLLPPLPGQGAFEMPGMASALVGMVGIPGLAGATPSDLFAAILKSRTVMDGVIKDCNLMAVYKEKTLKDTYETLTSNTDIKVSLEGIIAIATTAKTPELAKEIADSYVRNLDNLNKQLSMSIGKRNRVFLEERLEQVKNDLRIAEDSLRWFQEQHKTISIRDEIAPVLEAISDLKAQIIAKEIRLGILRKYATEDNPEVIKVKSELREFNKKLYDMEYRGDSDHFGLGFSIPLEKVPEIELQLARLARDIMIQQELFTLLTQQYEQAKIQEVKDTPTVEVLETAAIPEYRSFPRRKRIVIAAFIFSLAVGCILSFFLNWVENLNPDDRAHWEEIGNTLREDLRNIKRKITKRK